MSVTRRAFVSTLAASAIAAPGILRAQAPKVLKLSHQFPGGTVDQGDFRDRLCRKFAAEVEKRTGGAVQVQVYPSSSLMKTQAQFSAVRKGALDLTLYPLNYAGSEIYETNIGLMPALVENYEQAGRWKSAPVGAALTSLLDGKGVQILSWVWQSGSIAARSKPILTPEDVKGVKIRGGSREFDVMLSKAGAPVSTMLSNEIYIGLQTGALDAAISSSTSLISFRVDEVTKHLSVGRKNSFWFSFQPLLVSKSTMSTLSPSERNALIDVGAELEAFGQSAAKDDDEEIVKVFSARGVTVNDITKDHVAKWRALAAETAWNTYASKSPSCADLLKLAQSVPAS